MYRVLVDHSDREETESSAKDGKRAAHAGERNADLGTMCWSGSVFPLICCVGAQHWAHGGCVVPFCVGTPFAVFGGGRVPPSMALGAV